VLDFFNQCFLRAHGLKYPAKLVFGKPYCPVVHPKMNSENEFPSAFI
jgi:hypothetical protein